MEFSDVCAVLSRLGVDTTNLKPSEKMRVQVPCVLSPWFHESKADRHPSMSISFAEPPTRYRCFACHEAGKLWSLVDSYASLANLPDLKPLAHRLMLEDEPTLDFRLEKAFRGSDSFAVARKAAPPAVMSECVLDPFPDAWGVPECRGYLEGRRVDENLSRLFGLRYDPRNRRVIMPARNAKGQLLGAVGRTLERGAKYYNYFGFEVGKSLGGHQFVSRDRPRVMVVEGFFCLLRAFPWAMAHGADVVCTWTCHLSPYQAAAIQCFDKAISLWYDADKAGNRGVEEATKELLDYGGEVRRAPIPNGTDVGAMTEEIFGSVWARMLGAMPV